MEAIAGALGDTDASLTGTEIQYLLASSKMTDPGPITNHVRIYNAFVESQNTKGCPRVRRRRGLENGRKDVGVGWAALGHDSTVFAVTVTASAYKPLIYNQTIQKAQTVPKGS